MKKKLTLLIISSLAVGLLTSCGEQKSIDNNTNNEINNEVVEETKDEYEIDIEKDLTQEVNIVKEKVEESYTDELFDTVNITYTNNSDIEISEIFVDMTVNNTGRYPSKDNLNLTKGQSVTLDVPCDRKVDKYHINYICVTEFDRDNNKHRDVYYKYDTKEYRYTEWE